MNKKYCVYIHTFPNGKVYIGVTCRKPKYRWDNGNGYQKNQRKIYNAIQKYSWENVKHEILFENLTKEEAEQKEIELIKFYNSTDDNFGYNIEKGGSLNKEISEETRQLMIKNHKGMAGRKLTKEQCKTIGIYSKKRWETMSNEQKKERIEKMAKVNRGKPSWNKGVHFTDKARINMSIAQKKRYENGAVSPMKGKKHTTSAKIKMSQKRKGIKISEEVRQNMKMNNANARKIIILETGEIFNSGKECAEHLKCHRSNPNFACNGRTKTCKGYHLMWLDEYNQRNCVIANTLGDLVF